MDELLNLGIGLVGSLTLLGLLLVVGWLVMDDDRPNEWESSMLILARREEQDVILTTSDGEILVRIAEIRPSTVRLAIQAPLSVGITRPECQRRESGMGNQTA